MHSSEHHVIGLLEVTQNIAVGSAVIIFLIQENNTLMLHIKVITCAPKFDIFNH